MTDASSGSDKRRGRVCRATLAAALYERATDAPVLLQQTQCVRSIVVTLARGGAQQRQTRRASSGSSSDASVAAPRVGAYWIASIVATDA
jgi:hypothetical protein